MSRVHILVTVLHRKRLAGASLVFKTIRTGFPTSHIVVYGNGLDPFPRDFIEDQTCLVGGEFIPITMRSHGVWIEGLLDCEDEPFWICDTDVVFLDAVETWFKDGSLGALFAGRLEPEFVDPWWTGMAHVERLHPSVMWFDTLRLRAAVRGWPGTGEFLSSVRLPLFQWHFVPRKNQQPLFYDTCAGLWQALPGLPFNEEQNQCFEHLFCGTYVDIHCGQLGEVHRAVYQNVGAARGLWQKQQLWYQEHRVR